MNRPARLLAEPFRQALVSQVRGIFNDKARGERPVQRSSDGLFPATSVIWRVHGDVATMMIGGIAALCCQMLHPAALAGVWDHSTFRQDMSGRLRRTARFISETTYGDRGTAQAAIDRVKRIHAHVSGVMEDRRPYSAGDPHLLAWVHVSEAICFLDAWRRYGEPGMSLPDQDRYFAEFAEIAVALGADPVPRTRAEADALIRRFQPELLCNERTREVVDLVLHQPPASLAAAPFHTLTIQAAVDLLPPWAKALHGIDGPAFTRPAVRLSTHALAGTLRWAFQRERSSGQRPGRK